LSSPPEELTSFVGREFELADVVGLIMHRRLVTLTGIGGSGKTRLAGRVVERVGPGWRDGIQFIDLAPTTDPSLIPATVAAALGVPVDPDGDQVGRLAAQLQRKNVLLCLDTCEHVLDAVARMTAVLLERCPEVAVLATSRQPLDIAGETVWRVPSLRPEEAVRLFVDRASLVAHDFDSTDASEHVATICARVDHIALAIELAAAWVRALTPAQIASGLDDTFGLLVQGPRNAVPRHQTLEASMVWSHMLLSEQEQRLFQHLSVFPDTFTLDGAQAVAWDESDDATTDARAEVLPSVTRLLDASLLTTREVHGEVRYRMLDTVRQFAEARLAESGGTAGIRDRHLDYLLHLADEAEEGADVDLEHWRVVLASHRADMSAALNWALADPGDRSDKGRRLTAAMARFWLISGQTTEGLALHALAIDLVPDDASSTQARLLAGQSMLAMATGQLDLVAASAARGGEIAASAGDAATRARCLGLATFPMFFEDFQACATSAQEAQLAAEAVGETFGGDWAGVMEAYSLVTRNRLEEANALADQVFARSSMRRDRFCAAFARGVRIYTNLTGGDLQAAVTVGDEVVEMIQPLGDYFGVGTLTSNAAQAAALSGAVEKARAMIEPVIASLDPVRERDIVGLMVPIASIHLWTGELDEALHWFNKGVARLEERPRDWTAGRCLPGLVSTLRRLDRREEAMTWAIKGERMLADFDGPYEQADVLDEHGRLVAADDPDQARELHMQALVLRRDHGVRLGLPDSLDALATLAADAHDHQEAIRLVAASDAARRSMSYPRPPVNQPAHDEMLASLREAAGVAPFKVAWQEGQSAELDTLVASLTRGRGPRSRAPGRLGLLTPTEHEVALLASEGLSNPEIASRLFMSRSTVKAHLARTFTKLGIANRTALAHIVREDTSAD